MDDDYDDRMDRWCAANGVAKVGWRRLDDGSTQVFYTRADGSEVDMNDQYGYDALLTPYTDVAGRA